MKALAVAILLWPALALAANLPPTITGTPAPVAPVGQVWAFTPTAKDPEGQRLKFVIKNRPGWATFSYQTGRLSGTPTAAHIKTYSNIVIYVQDGVNRSVAMKAFSVTVPSSSVGSVGLSWTDWRIANMAGYRIYYGPAETALTQMIQVGVDTTYAIVKNLTTGKWYFVVVPYSTTGSEGPRSNVASKTIG